MCAISHIITLKNIRPNRRFKLELFSYHGHAGLCINNTNIYIKWPKLIIFRISPILTKIRLFVCLSYIRVARTRKALNLEICYIESPGSVSLNLKTHSFKFKLVLLLFSDFRTNLFFAIISANHLYITYYVIRQSLTSLLAWNVLSISIFICLSLV